MLKNTLKRLISKSSVALPFVFSLYKLKQALFLKRHLALLPLVWMDQSKADEQGCLRKGNAVAMEELTFEEQIRTIRNADFIAGPTGASWTNLIFCRPDTHCLCWMAEESGDFASFSNIAMAVGVRLDYLTGRNEAGQKDKPYQQRYRLDIDELDAYLRRNLDTARHTLPLIR